MFLQAPARDALQLYTAIDRRIQALKKDRKSNHQTSEESEESAETTENGSEKKKDDVDNEGHTEAEKNEKQLSADDSRPNSINQSENNIN